MKLKEWEECCCYMQKSIDQMKNEYGADIRLSKVMLGNNEYLAADVYDSGGDLYKSFTAIIRDKDEPDGISAKERSIRNIDDCMCRLEEEMFA